MATRRRSRRKTISGNLTDIQKRIRYLETRPAAGRLASKAVATRNLALRAVEADIIADNAIVRRSIDQGAVGTLEIEGGSITTEKIDNLGVTTEKLDNESVTTAKIDDLSVTTEKIDDLAVTTAKINNLAVITGKINNFAVTNDKLSGEITNDKLVGISTSKLDGDVEDDQINTLSASKISGVLDEFAIPDLATSKIISGVLDIDTVPEITEDRMPNLDTSKFTSGIFDESLIPELNASKITSGTFNVARIPNLEAFKFTSGTFDVARIPNISAAKLTSGTLSLDRIPVFPESEIATDAVGSDEINAGAVTEAKISTLRSVRGGIVDGGLTVVYPMTKGIISGISPSSGLVGIGLVNNSAGFNAAEGNHTHGQNGYSAISSTGVASHTHPVSIAQSPFFNPLGGNGTHGGHTGSGNNGSHVHQTPGFDGTATSNTSTLKLKKDISEYEVPEIKKLLDLQLKRYKYKNQVRYLQESINRDWMYGYIAEEVENLGFKELVGYDEKGEPASLNYGLLSTLILELVKVQQTEISLIKEKIKRRREKYDKLSS